MIETEQSVRIEAPIGRVWDYAGDIQGWARLMPGLQDCEVLDADHSLWTLKVGAGALVRTVRVAVQVEYWAGPVEVLFSYSLKGDPVKGAGSFRAEALGEATQVTLNLWVEGTGPMAPMWEAMGRPLLPKFARGFAEQFKAEIEQLAPERPALPLWARWLDWLGSWFGRKAAAKPEGSRS